MIGIVESGLDGGYVDIVGIFRGIIKKVENFVVLVEYSGHGGGA